MRFSVADSYRLWGRLKAKVFSLAIGTSFASFGRHSIIVPPTRLANEHRIEIGTDVYIGADSWLHCDGSASNVILRIGDGCTIAGACVLSAVSDVVLEDKVLLARNVYISDHIHRYDQHDVAVVDQGVGKVLPVRIKSGAWLGQNVVVCPGVTIGRGAVIGANSVVLEDIPDYCVAAGAPARVVRGAAAMEHR